LFNYDTFIITNHIIETVIYLKFIKIAFILAILIFTLGCTEQQNGTDTNTGDTTPIPDGLDPDTVNELMAAKGISEDCNVLISALLQGDIDYTVLQAAADAGLITIENNIIYCGGTGAAGDLLEFGAPCSNNIIPENPSIGQFWDAVDIDEIKEKQLVAEYDMRGVPIINKMTISAKYPYIKADAGVSATYVNAETGKVKSCSSYGCVPIDMTTSGGAEGDTTTDSFSMDFFAGGAKYTQTSNTSTKWFYSGAKKVLNYKTYCFTSIPNSVNGTFNLDGDFGTTKIIGNGTIGPGGTEIIYTIITPGGVKTVPVSSSSSNSGITSICYCNNGMPLYQKTISSDGTIEMEATNTNFNASLNDADLQAPESGGTGGTGMDTSVCDQLPAEQKQACIDAFAQMS